MRSTQEVFENHLLLTLDWDQDLDIKNNYSENCTLLTSKGIFKGHEGVKKFESLLYELLPDADYLYINRIWHEDVAFLEWQAESPGSYIDDGAETFLIKDGLIVTQTVHFTIRSRTC